MSEPRFELGISDPIANHITTRPRGIYKIVVKNFAMLLISNMIYLYGLIQPIRGRNRVKKSMGKVVRIILLGSRWPTSIHCKGTAKFLQGFMLHYRAYTNSHYHGWKNNCNYWEKSYGYRICESMDNIWPWLFGCNPYTQYEL